MTKKDSLHDVYLSLGSNLGNREDNIKEAMKYIQERIGECISLSAFYITEPMGFDSDNLFVNVACHVRTELRPTEVLVITQEIEKELGRATKSVNKAYSDRLIDIDILLFDNIIQESQGLTIPHPHMHERGFVLEPLSEIAPNVEHPILKETMKELLTNL